MDKTEINRRIEQEIILIKKDISALKAMTKPISPENAIGRISRMDAINNKSVNEASLRQSENKLMQLEAALSKIDQSDFGICTGCQQPIPIGRLMLMPHARRCVKCA